MISTRWTIRGGPVVKSIVRVSISISIPRRRDIRWDAEDVPEFWGWRVMLAKIEGMIHGSSCPKMIFYRLVLVLIDSIR